MKKSKCPKTKRECRFIRDYPTGTYCGKYAGTKGEGLITLPFHCPEKNGK